MYLLNTPKTIQWELLAGSTVHALGDLDLIIIEPDGVTTYVNAPIEAGNYVPPTDVSNGEVLYNITPNKEGLWRIRLVVGSAVSYQILSKVEMYVFDNSIVTSPYSDEIGRPAPYDINFYLQGFIVPNEIYGTFVASRTITIDTNSPGAKALAEDSCEFFETTLIIRHNGTQVGTIVFPIDSLTGTITIDPILVSPGDKLQIDTGAAVVDARLRDIAINLVGCCIVVPCTVL